jgi:hypothetical protein
VDAPAGRQEERARWDDGPKGIYLVFCVSSRAPGMHMCFKIHFWRWPYSTFLTAGSSSQGSVKLEGRQND